MTIFRYGLIFEISAGALTYVANLIRMKGTAGPIRTCASARVTADHKRHATHESSPEMLV